ncbi:FecR domain-containing protein [bacterium]|nr:FecR domain-containing protein [bacterium]
MIKKTGFIKTYNFKILTWALMLCIFSISAAGSHSVRLPSGNVEDIEGEVYLQHPWETMPSIAKVKDEIFLKDKIKTVSGSKVKLRFINGALLDIGENTDLEVKEFYYSASDGLSKSGFKMKLGRLRAIVGKFANPKSRFEIQTTTAVSGVVGTEEIIVNEKAEKDGKEKETTRVICTDGYIEVGNADPDMPAKVKIGPLQQVWVFEDEMPGEIEEISLEAVEEILEGIVLSVEEEWAAKGYAQPAQEEMARGKPGEEAGEKPEEEDKRAEERVKEEDEIRDEERAGEKEAEGGAGSPYDILGESEKETVEEEMTEEITEGVVTEASEEISEEIAEGLTEEITEEVIESVTEDIINDIIDDIIEESSEEIEEKEVDYDLPEPPSPPYT